MFPVVQIKHSLLFAVKDRSSVVFNQVTDWNILNITWLEFKYDPQPFFASRTGWPLVGSSISLSPLVVASKAMDIDIMKKI